MSLFICRLIFIKEIHIYLFIGRKMINLRRGSCRGSGSESQSKLIYEDEFRFIALPARNDPITIHHQDICVLANFVVCIINHIQDKCIYTTGSRRLNHREIYILMKHQSISVKACKKNKLVFCFRFAG